MVELKELTVLQLKHRLRQHNAKVSGNKSELILRLKQLDVETFISIEGDMDEDDFEVESLGDFENEELINSDDDSSDKVIIACLSCSRMIRFPAGYEGNMTCPSCGSKVRVNGSSQMPGEVILFMASIVVMFLTVVIYGIYVSTTEDSSVYNDTGLEIWFFGILSSGRLFISSIIGLFLRIIKN